VKFRRLGELLLVLVVCGTLAFWSQRATAPSRSSLEELSYQDWPFQYSLRVLADGSADYQASFNCVAATPEPGQLGCQHLEGHLSKKQMEGLWSGLCATHPERYSAVKNSAPGPGAGASLELQFAGKSMWLSDSEPSHLVFTALNRLHPGAIRKRLESMRAQEERALK